MKNLTHEILVYRDHLRHLWNSFFMPLRGDPFDKIDLFEIVAQQIYDFSFSNFDDQSAVYVKINSFLESSRINIERPSSDGNKYWDNMVDFRPLTDKATLKFQGFFDWNKNDNRDFEYATVIIEKWENRPEFNNFLALVRVNHCLFVSRDFS